jgi:hypothetical protein
MKPEPIDQALLATAQAVHKTKAEWLDSQMQRIMPPEVYALSKKDKGSARFTLARWVSEQKIEVRESESEKDKMFLTLLMRGDDLVSRFSVRFKDDKAETSSKDYPV